MNAKRGAWSVILSCEGGWILPIDFRIVNRDAQKNNRKERGGQEGPAMCSSYMPPSTAHFIPFVAATFIVIQFGRGKEERQASGSSEDGKNTPRISISEGSSCNKPKSFQYV